MAIMRILPVWLGPRMTPAGVTATVICPPISAVAASPPESKNTTFSFFGSPPAALVTSAAASWLCPPGELETPMLTLCGSVFSFSARSLPDLIGEFAATEKMICSVTSTASGVTSLRPISLWPVIVLVISGRAWMQT